MLGSQEDAEDVLQEVFAASFGAIRADERPINARPWFYRIARNRCLNHLRRPRATGHDSMDIFERDGGTTTADTVHKREEFRHIVADVQELPETQRTALLLREIDALSYDQIAEAMDTTVPSVKSLLVRARVALAEAAESRLLTCGEVRLELAQVAEGIAKSSSPVRRHLKTCERCRTFRGELRKTTRALAALAPIGPLLLLKKLWVIKLGAGGAAGAGAAAGSGGGAAAGAGVAGATAAAAGGITAGGAVSAGVSTIASKAAAGMAAAVIVTAGAVEVKHATQPAVAPQSQIAVAPPIAPAPPAAAVKEPPVAAKRNKHPVKAAVKEPKPEPVAPPTPVATPPVPAEPAPAPAPAPEPAPAPVQEEASTVTLPPREDEQAVVAPPAGDPGPPVMPPAESAPAVQQPPPAPPAGEPGAGTGWGAVPPPPPPPPPAP